MIKSLFVFFFVFVLFTFYGCSAEQKKAEVVGLNLANMACELLDDQPEMDWLQVLCKVEEAAHPGIVKLIHMRIAKKHYLDAGILDSGK